MIGTNLLHRLAAWLVRHASRTMPHTRSIWADAMRSEFEHIKDQPGALLWAAGCILASYKCRLAELQARHALQWVRGVAVCSLAALLAGYAVANQACGQTVPPPAFTDTACDMPHVSPGIRPRLRCGTVSVPRDYEHPEAGTFRLAVVVIRSEQQPATSDPVVYISGGPGSPLTVHAYEQATHPVARGRDLILVDQRGMGRSDPSICPNHNSDLVPAMATFVLEPTADAQARRRAAFIACRDEAIANGIDLKDFGTAATVRDFDAVRQALGVKQWDVFGVSYGTTVAMTLMARYPDTIRSAVLDSVDPPDPFLPLESIDFADDRAALFAACDRDTACAAAYPHLGEMYQATLAQLNHSPPALVLPPELRAPTPPGRLTAPLFEFVIDQLIYYARFYPGLPRLVASVQDGDTTPFARVLASLLAEATDPETGTNFSANVAVQCRDRPRFRQKLPDDANVLDRTTLYDVCRDWETPGPPPVIPVGTGVPTLVLAGEFDPVARPVVSRHVADLIGARAQWVEFSSTGHSVRSSSQCAAGIVAAFVDDPTRALDTTCASHPPPIRFLPPGGNP
jgi:pimeloyl-ACP methyl ester carboxylesterase